MDRITNKDDSGLDLIAQFEGLRTKAYLDSGNLPTIGFGTTRYPSGDRVKMGDTCTKQQALEWLKSDVAAAEKSVDDLTIDTINQNQFNALVSFVYNVGQGAYKTSTLRRLVNLNPTDPHIQDEFMKWVKVGSKVIDGLKNRRAGEVAKYFS